MVNPSPQTLLHALGIFASLFAALLGCQQRGEESVEPAKAVEAREAVTSAAVQAPRGVAVWVNDAPIHEADIDRRLDHLQRLYRHTKRPFDVSVREKKRAHVIDGLIDKELLRQHVQKHEVTIPDEDVDAEFRRRVDTVFGNLDALNRYLADQDTSIQEFRSRLRHELAVNIILEAEAAGQATTEAEIRELYERIANRRPARERVEASVILVRVPPGSSEVIRKRIMQATEKAVATAKDREQFAALAGKMSQGPTAREGGYVGWIERNTLSPAADLVIFGTTAGKPSAPVATAVGFEVFWVHQKRAAGMRHFDEVEHVLRERAAQGRVDENRRRLVGELREQASIRYASIVSEKR
ncbi:MAG: peptidylprolyl isomerase [Bradymonadaceae bacterium]|nr:peptidylprolyl isomerase [Lujinxingiaceae bacterium]